ncbi:hypothetical protein MTZ49_11020 [Entomomonas sp. E2T0]|uniref:hypothetical protein n=1 Tax=Entomomonas sp. E2T0 TaxID=2930213 RepID=UPI00222841E1|nr:hypothetical protein [Entomomonas sp. E2T0]UYZ83129.1 hypothetical protein MTZ49_11020 [Entomomonas sp. E2T0]
MKVAVIHKVKAIDDETFNFLAKYEPKFSEENEVQRAINSFTILWMIFEQYFFDKNPPPHTSQSDQITNIVKKWSSSNPLIDNFWTTELLYFKNRYIKTNGGTTDYFRKLQLSSEYYKTYVKKVLSGESNAPKDILTALLYIILRFRNNLLHGTKWPSGMDQKENFDTCSSLLRSCLERFKYNAETN